MLAVGNFPKRFLTRSRRSRRTELALAVGADVELISGHAVDLDPVSSICASLQAAGGIGKDQALGVVTLCWTSCVRTLYACSARLLEIASVLVLDVSQHHLQRSKLHSFGTPQKIGAD